jgi:hypothetical protein
MQVDLIGVCVRPSGHAESSLKVEVHDIRSRLAPQFYISKKKKILSLRMFCL